ncbi:MAG: hypothetical protein ACTTJ4_09570, partial [Treponema sp.]|uniref:hypothetical protein n=1 Tax=Treponema sp. TaxID=166 RepID=UPI003FA3053C
MIAVTAIRIYIKEIALRCYSSYIGNLLLGCSVYTIMRYDKGEAMFIEIQPYENETLSVRFK